MIDLYFRKLRGIIEDFENEALTVIFDAKEIKIFQVESRRRCHILRNWDQDGLASFLS